MSTVSTTLQLGGASHNGSRRDDRALDKMLKGTYGLCGACRRPIAKARLEALPFAALCVSCKSGGLTRRLTDESFMRRAWIAVLTIATAVVSGRQLHEIVAETHLP